MPAPRKSPPKPRQDRHQKAQATGQPKVRQKTHRTAVVLIPPRDLWGPIQAIRRRQDRQFRRWMPHITLLYPFLTERRLAGAAERLAPVCRGIPPFEVTLARFDQFHQGHGHHTVWLDPEPAGPIASLQEALWRRFPDCAETRGFRGGFHPHLSVGQVQGKGRLEALLTRVSADWQPLVFNATEVAIIARGEPPDDVFRVLHRLPLGRSDP
jgi:2'-5' RNA ligase